MINKFENIWKIKWFRVGVLFVLWVFFTGAAALYSKAFLDIVPMPMYLTLGQSALGCICSYLYLRSKGPIQSTKGVNWFDFGLILGTHFIGTAWTNMANLYSSASFVNTLKAADPLFAIWLAKFILHQEFTVLTWTSLFIIVFGIILACTTEFNFQLGGFLTAMGSNACFTTRAVYTKKVLRDTKVLNSQSIFLYISYSTFLFSLLPTLWEIRLNGTEVFMKSLDTSSNAFSYFMLAVISHYGYNFLSFFLVVEMDALSYSVGNSVKRLVTIYSAIIYFKNPVTTMNMFASVMAVFGVFLYSYDRDVSSRPTKDVAKKNDIV